MIALLLALAAQNVAAPTAPRSNVPLIAPIGRQQLPARGCAAYLWSTTDRQLVAMAVADPGTIRLAVGGQPAVYQRTSEEGAGKLGFAGDSQYRGGDLTATLSMEIVLHEGLTAGGQVSSGTLRIDRTGGDSVVMPVVGLIGCAA